MTYGISVMPDQNDIVDKNTNQSSVQSQNYELRPKRKKWERIFAKPTSDNYLKMKMEIATIFGFYHNI